MSAVIAIAGVGIGLLLTLVAARAVESVLYGIRASDPLIYAAAALLIGTVAIGAAFLPARRAASTMAVQSSTVRTR